ncbi:LEAF RUST 10 DISEASE-RESISTANCE LOCUS RECEPTOR-LIKE PROTEIN KINASE-like 2.4 [Cucumis sativus]|nr:LEAF RUST 10 DISEASE-RESISTANCE LOCUS RECEPTOR-LIKE PROTEIN KINASE-like 2.4 [Cucumis sativus]
MIIYIRRRKRLSTKSSSISNRKKYGIDSIINYGPKRYHYSEIKKMTNSFSTKIGEGGYGIVYQGKLLDGTLVAIKVLKLSKANGEDFINEVMSISRTSHVNIVGLLGFCYTSRKAALIYEFMANGSLDRFMSRSHNHEMKMLHRIVTGVARGLEYLHCGCSTRIVHFDIKPQNILLDEDSNPKISDFGLAKLCKRKVSAISMLGTRGTAGFIAPEVFSPAFGIVSYKSDVYSYGMLVLDLVLGGIRNNPNRSRLLSDDDSEMYFPNWVFKNIEMSKSIRMRQSLMEEEEEEMEKKMTMIGLWCIQTSPIDRPTMSRVLEMLEGSIHSLQMPPRPLLVAPNMATQQSTSESLSYI